MHLVLLRQAIAHRGTRQLAELESYCTFSSFTVSNPDSYFPRHLWVQSSELPTFSDESYTWHSEECYHVNYIMLHFHSFYFWVVFLLVHLILAKMENLVIVRTEKKIFFVKFAITAFLVLSLNCIYLICWCNWLNLKRLSSNYSSTFTEPSLVCSIDIAQ